MTARLDQPISPRVAPRDNDGEPEALPIRRASRPERFGLEDKLMLGVLGLMFGAAAVGLGSYMFGPHDALHRYGVDEYHIR